MVRAAQQRGYPTPRSAVAQAAAVVANVRRPWRLFVRSVAGKAGLTVVLDFVLRVVVDLAICIGLVLLPSLLFLVVVRVRLWVVGVGCHDQWFMSLQRK